MGAKVGGGDPGGHGQRGGREGMGTIVGGKGVDWCTGWARKTGACGAEEDGGHRASHGRSVGGGTEGR